MLRLLVVLLLASPLLAQGKGPSKPLGEARQKACAALAEMKLAMTKKGMKGEAEDCDAIAAELKQPSKQLSAKGAGAPYPGDEAYEEVLAAWSELGKRLAGIYEEAAPSLEGREKEEAETYAGWFATWDQVGVGIRRLNRRRRFSKLGPVTCSWAGSLGGYLHGVYLEKNAHDPSVEGLGAHNEAPGLPGATPEGAEAAGGILGAGGAEGSIDMWCGSRFHREPVLNRSVGRVSFGGLPRGWWSCREAPGGAPKQQPDVVVYPGDGDTDIPTAFFGEAPDPFPPGVRSSGTIVYVEFFKNRPKRPKWRLLDPDGAAVEILTLDEHPLCFVAKEALKRATKYTIEVTGQDRFKFTSTFTTQ